jgi:hypothetical protein
MGKINPKLQGTDIVVGFDGNEDGQNSIEAKLHLGEVYEEIMKKGEAKVGAVVTFKREGGKITMLVDSDKDGQPVASLSVDAVEGLEEAIK